jgi:hypothetical protein
VVQGPPGRAPGAPAPAESDRCDGCGGALYWTMRHRAPMPQDHVRGCPEYSLAGRIVRYRNELERAVSSLEKRTRDPDERAWRKYIDRARAEFASAARTSSPSDAVSRLRSRYTAASPVQDRKGAEGIAAAAAMLSQACTALAEGKDPGPVIVFKQAAR